MQRQNQPKPPSSTYPQTDSPLTIPHGSFAGFCLAFDTDTTSVTVTADGTGGGNFADSVELEGSARFKYPSVVGANTAYNAAFLRIAWDAGNMTLVQKS